MIKVMQYNVCTFTEKIQLKLAVSCLTNKLQTKNLTYLIELVLIIREIISAVITATPIKEWKSTFSSSSSLSFIDGWLKIVDAALYS